MCVKEDLSTRPWRWYRGWNLKDCWFWDTQEMLQQSHQNVVLLLNLLCNKTLRSLHNAEISCRTERGEEEKLSDLNIWRSTAVPLFCWRQGWRDAVQECGSRWSTFCICLIRAYMHQNQWMTSMIMRLSMSRYGIPVSWSSVLHKARLRVKIN